jgi:hypothetical protein
LGQMGASVLVQTKDIPVRMYLVYLKLISDSGTFLAPECGCKAPHTTLMMLFIYNLLGKYTRKTNQGYSGALWQLSLKMASIMSC